MKKTLFIIATLCAVGTTAQVRNSDVWQMPEREKAQEREMIHIPGFDKYQTLKCDFHIHTVFSDGRVWPETRVIEAWHEGLDAIAITDHIEYLRHKDYLSKDLNASYEIAAKKGKDYDFIVIKGAEITRKKPEGHINTLFISDVNPLVKPTAEEAVNEAVKQGGFIMWNHPGWPDNKSVITPMHEKLLKEKKIHGIEVHNFVEYYPKCIDWCTTYDLALLGNSDIHEPVSLTFHPNGKFIRPLTLVFAKEKSEEGIKEALFAGRTASYFNNLLLGKEEWLKKLFIASISVKKLSEAKNGKLNVIIENNSDLTYILNNDGNEIIVPGDKIVRAQMTKDGKVKVTNAKFGENKCIEYTFKINEK